MLTPVGPPMLDLAGGTSPNRTGQPLLADAGGKTAWPNLFEGPRMPPRRANFTTFARPPGESTIFKVQDPPRWPQEGSKSVASRDQATDDNWLVPRNGPERPHDGSKMAPRGPKWPQDGPKRAPGRWLGHALAVARACPSGGQGVP